MGGFDLICGAVDKALFGRRELWVRCHYQRGHHEPHNDPKHPEYVWHETVFWDEFEPGKVVKGTVKRKVKTCDTCGKRIRTDGANGACVCKEIGARQQQGIMFASERERTARDEAALELANDIAELMAEHAAWQKKYAEDRDAYYGSF